MRDEWYVARRGQGENARYGPAPLRQLRQLLDDGKVHGDDLVWCEGMADWRRADRCDDLFPPRPGYDERPYPRRPPPRQSSGWVVGLVVGGGVLAVCFLACAGVGVLDFLSARSGPAFGPPIAPPMATVPPAAPVPDDGAIFNPNLNGGLPGALGQKIAFKTSELFYTANVTADEAQDVGNYLDDKGLFPDDRAVTVQLDKPFGAYQVRFCVRPEAAGDADVVNFYRDLRTDIANDVFQAADVEVHLCDQNMVTVRVLRLGD